MFDEESSKKLRQLMDFTGEHGSFHETSYFSIAITGRIEAEQNGELLTLKVVIDPKRANVKIEPTEEDADAAPNATAITDIPANLVAHAPRSALWQDVRQNFIDLLRVTLTQETIFHFGDVVNATFLEYDPTLGSKRQIIEAHVERTAERLKRAFQITTKGKPSEWTPLELTRAIRGIMRGLPKSRRTYDTVAKKMQTVYGDKAPASGEALRKLVDRLELDWRSLKTGH